MQHAEPLVQAYAEHVEGQIALTTETIAKARARLERLERLAADVPAIDMDETIFRVDIRSVYDGTNRRGDGTERAHAVVTERGLEQAIKIAEGPRVRTDGVLTYHVWAMLPGLDLPVPDAVWMPLSAQTPQTVRA